VLSTASCLDPARYTPIVAAPRGDRFFQALDSAGVRTVPLPFSGITDIGTVASLRRFILDNDVALIHAHLGISTILSLAASELAGGIPVVATRHFIGDRYTTIGNKALYNIYLEMYRRVNSALKRVIFVSEAVRRGVQDREGDLGSKGIVIYNGIGLQGRPTGGKNDGETARLRERYGATPDSFFVVTLSRLVAEKGLVTLIGAAAELKNDKSDFHFVIAGDGPQCADLGRQAENAAVSASVHFAGYVEYTASLLAAADVFVLCAHAEPFGIAVLEAMAAGAPVIAARSGGPLEIIREGGSGLFFEPGDSKDLAKKIRLLDGDTEMRRRLSRGAISRVADFDESLLANRMQDVYDDVLAESTGGRKRS
jgi:glycosyltransferase involved in cell wall biosynthesis